jgi:hypothetical protein
LIPHWLEAWWESFGKGNESYIKAVADDSGVIGIAPLMISNGSLKFIGNTDVCDYQDFIISPGHEESFFAGLFSSIKADGLKNLELKHVRPDSHTMNTLHRMPGIITARLLQKRKTPRWRWSFRRNSRPIWIH